MLRAVRKNTFICCYLKVITVHIHFWTRIVSCHHVPLVFKIVCEKLFILRTYQRVHEIWSSVELGITPQKGLYLLRSCTGSAWITCVATPWHIYVDWSLNIRNIVARNSVGLIHRQAKPCTHAHFSIESINIWQPRPMLFCTGLERNVHRLIGLSSLNQHSINGWYVEVARTIGKIITPKLDPQHEFFPIIVCWVWDRRRFSSLNGVSNRSDIDFSKGIKEHSGELWCQEDDDGKSNDATSQGLCLSIFLEPQELHRGEQICLFNEFFGMGEEFWHWNYC